MDTNSLVKRDRVSETQFNIILDFLERHPTMVSGYNNSREKRDQNNRLWQALATLLNANRIKFRRGMTRSAKRWATYVSNYKCKLKKTIAAMEKADKAVLLEFSDKEVRFMVVTGLVQPSDVKHVNWDPLEEPSTSTEPEFLDIDVKPNENDIVSFNMDSEKNDIVSMMDDEMVDNDDDDIDDKSQVTKLKSKTLYSPVVKSRPKHKKPAPSHRRTQHYKPPETSLNTVLRLLKKQQATIDAQSRLLKRIAQNSTQSPTNRLGSLNLIAYNLGRLADAADRYVAHNARRTRSSHIS